jgi:hypothetical protein
MNPPFLAKSELNHETVIKGSQCGQVLTRPIREDPVSPNI